ncbi:MAG: hypothetical protein IJT32_08035 [Lachnospiraceae bacterium]|nr:hypothetical protein [Lachnospiraceae bacterium]
MKKYDKRRAFGSILALFLCFLLCAPGMTAAAEDANSFSATYLGVYDYGGKGVDIFHADSLRYRFLINGSETVLPVANGPDYPIQNLLIEGDTYVITVASGTVVSVQPQKPRQVVAPAYLAAGGTPGMRTLKNFLSTALMPVGGTLYVYGGGWNWQDTGAGLSARTIGVPYEWQTFYLSHYRNYTYKDGTAASYYPYGGFNEYGYAGLDCSGYLGWTLYNTFETAGGREGYVTKSTSFAKSLAGRGWGTFTQNVSLTGAVCGASMRPGDIMSMNGHVWLSLGTCSDGSVLIAHSIPSKNIYGQQGGGVQLSAVGRSTDCEAYRLADAYMSAHCPVWHSYYPTQLVSPGAYFAFSGNEAGAFLWDVSGAGGGLTDPDGIRNMTPKEVLAMLAVKKN